MKSVTMSDMVALGDATCRRIYLEERLKRLPMTVREHDALTRRHSKAVTKEREAQERLRRVLKDDIDDPPRPVAVLRIVKPGWVQVYVAQDRDKNIIVTAEKEGP